MTEAGAATSAVRPSLGWRATLWIAQILLSLLYGAAGAMKSIATPEALATMGVAYATDIPFWLLRFIGYSELAGAVGIVLPALIGVEPGLTPLAAAGFSIIQVLAIGFHIMRGETNALSMNLPLLGLSLFVLWGWIRRPPVASRGR
ncbi:DoxX family protein [Methylosinus sp. C49]|uniref:DoxX family protein n=1 Tax=Methylosinus sp. C49 TaxID=2699395 RepID=UPI001379563B|nr:DoxX family protein [Methylosinus sp. C49]